ncbi:hypothetical protein ACP4OV_015841 [Aristida adscensionis]
MAAEKGSLHPYNILLWFSVWLSQKFAFLGFIFPTLTYGISQDAGPVQSETEKSGVGTGKGSVHQKWSNLTFVTMPIESWSYHTDRFDQKKDQVKVGFLIRDEEGDAICAGRGKLEHLINPFQEEVIAVLQGFSSSAYDLSADTTLIWEVKNLIQYNA